MPLGSLTFRFRSCSISKSFITVLVVHLVSIIDLLFQGSEIEKALRINSLHDYLLVFVLNLSLSKSQVEVQTGILYLPPSLITQKNATNAHPLFFFVYTS